MLQATVGKIFIGDVRSLRHLKYFHASVTCHRATPDTSLKTLKQRTNRSLHQEKELVIDPSFFIDFAQHHPKISHVDIQLKTGHCENELNDYRYDIILHVNKPAAISPEILILDWQAEQLTPAALKKYLKPQQLSLIHLTNIPNQRWAQAHQLIQCFDQPEENQALAECVPLFATGNQQAISPAVLTQLAATHNYEVFCTFSARENTACFDAVLRLQSHALLPYLGQAINHDDVQAVNWQSYANKPWQISCHRKIHDLLHQYLLDKLPHYMIPSVFVVINEIPITPNGKLDRKALTDNQPIITTDYQAPNTEIEQALIDIWRDTLGIDEIGVMDNFFQLGGHSLNALHVIHAIEQRWHIALDVIRLFETPTVLELAQEIQKLSQSYSAREYLSSCLVTLSKSGQNPPLFLIHPVGGTVFCYIPLVESLSINHPIIGIQDPGITDPELVFRSLTEMAAYYIQLIKSKQPSGPYYLAGASLGGTLAAEMAHQLVTQGDTVALHRTV